MAAILRTRFWRRPLSSTTTEVFAELVSMVPIVAVPEVPKLPLTVNFSFGNGVPMPILTPSSKITLSSIPNKFPAFGIYPAFKFVLDALIYLADVSHIAEFASLFCKSPED